MSTTLSNALTQPTDSLRSFSESGELLVHSVTEAFRDATHPSLSTAKLFAWTAVASLVIGLVSALDIYLTIAYWVSLVEMEMNPVAHRILFPEDAGYRNEVGMALFIGLKAAGTVVVISILQLLAAFRYRHAIPVIGSVTAFQLLLLCFFFIG